MAQLPSINDSYNDLLFKLAQNLYDKGVALGKTDLEEPSRGWTDYDLLRAAVQNSAAIAS